MMKEFVLIRGIKIAKHLSIVLLILTCSLFAQEQTKTSNKIDKNLGY